MGDMSFVSFLTLATSDDEEMNMSMTEGGLDALYDVFEHFSEGGSVHDFDYSKSSLDNPEEITAVLAVAWLDVQRYIKEKRNSDF